MTILHVITGLQKAAGTSVFVGELAAEQAAAGHEVAILVKHRCAKEYPVSSKVEIVSSSSCASFPASRSYDIVHVHALWDPWLTRMARHYRKAGAKIVWSPHGMLRPWALKYKWPKKLIALLAYQYWALRSAGLIHVTADSETEDVRRLFLSNRIVLAPLGAHLRPSPSRDDVNGRNCPSPVDAESLPRREEAQAEQKYICFVSRIQRVKGLPNLLRAWAQVPSDLKRGWQIKIAGPDQDNHLAELYALCDELKIPYAPAPGDAPQSDNPTIQQPVRRNPDEGGSNNSQILFLGPVYDAARDALYANAAVSVLPTYSENFGSVVIESLAQGTPVICTKGAPWRDLVDFGCGWWIDIGVAPLVAALTQFLNTPTTQLRAMGARGHALVDEKYTWPAVVKAMIRGYEQILNPCPEASCDLCYNYSDMCQIG